MSGNWCKRKIVVGKEFNVFQRDGLFKPVRFKGHEEEMKLLFPLQGLHQQ